MRQLNSYNDQTTNSRHLGSMSIRGVHPVPGAHTDAYKMDIWLLSTWMRWPKSKADHLHIQPRSKNESSDTSTPPYVFMTWVFALLLLVQLRYKMPVKMNALTFLMQASRPLNRVPPTAVRPSRATHIAFTVWCITCQCLYIIPCCAAVHTLKGDLGSNYCTVGLG